MNCAGQSIGRSRVGHPWCKKYPKAGTGTNFTQWKTKQRRAEPICAGQSISRSRVGHPWCSGKTPLVSQLKSVTCLGKQVSWLLLVKWDSLPASFLDMQGNHCACTGQQWWGVSYFSYSSLHNWFLGQSAEMCNLSWKASKVTTYGEMGFPSRFIPGHAGKPLCMHWATMMRC